VEGRSCSEILYQIVAAREALKRVGVEIAKQHICQRTSEGEDMEQEIEKDYQNHCIFVLG